MHFTGQHVLPFSDIGGDIELSRTLGVLRVPHFLAVHPNVHGVRTRFKVEEHAPPLPAVGDRKLMAVSTGG